MDFTLPDDGREAAGLARTILEDHATDDRLRSLEREGEPYDRALWSALAGADLLGLGVPTGQGGSGLGFLSLCLLLQEVGRTVAPVPAYATLVLGALPLARFGPPETASTWLPEIVRGERLVTAALTEPGSSDPSAPATRARGTDGDVRLTGTKTLVPDAAEATHVLVPAVHDDGTIGLFWVEPDAPGVQLTPQCTPDRRPHAELVLDGAPAAGALAVGQGGDALRWIVERATAARAMTQLGVVERALEMTAAYTRERVQFDRPIGSFQAVHQRAADAYIAVEALRLTAWEAAWRLGEELPSTGEVAVAKYHAAEGGQLTAYACQHLHGGIGIDTDYPLHRYFLWATQLEHELGSARHQLEHLGALLAAAD